MAKEKKITVRFKNKAPKKNMDKSNIILCRVIYNQDSTTFNLNITDNNYIEIVRDDHSIRFKNTISQLNKFEVWLKRIIKFEANFYGEKYILRGLSYRISHVYSPKIRYYLLEEKTLDMLLLDLDDVLTYRKYLEIQDRGSYRLLMKEEYEKGLEFILKIKQLLENYSIDFSIFPEYTKKLIKVTIYFCFFDFKYSLKETRELTYHLSGQINVGDWLIDENYSARYLKFIKDFDKSLFYGTVAYDLAVWVSDNFPLENRDFVIHAKELNSLVIKHMARESKF